MGTSETDKSLINNSEISQNSAEDLLAKTEEQGNPENYAENEKSYNQFKEEITSKDIEKNLKLRRKDFKWRIKNRKSLTCALLNLLFIQNILIFGLLFYSAFRGQLKDLELLFSIIVPATLGETAFMVQIIVKFLFSEINYRDH